MRIWIKKIFNRLNGRLERISIGQRTMLTFFIVVILSVGLLAGFTSIRSANVLSSEVMAASRQMVQSTARAIDERFLEATRVGNLTLQQHVVIRAMERIRYAQIYPLSEQITDVREMEDFLYRLQFSHDLVRVRLLLRGDSIYTHENVNFFPLSEAHALHLEALRRQGIYVEIVEDFFPYIFQNARRVFSVYCSLEAPNNYFSVIGAVSVDFSTDEIATLLSQMLASTHDAAVLYNPSGQAIVAVGDPSLILLSTTAADAEHWQTTSDNHALFLDTPLSTLGWRLSYRINRTQLFSSVTLLQRDLLFGLLLILALAYLLTLLSSRLNVRRIRNLASAMECVWHGDMDIRVPEGGSNEIGVLEHSFNYLLNAMQEMLEHKMQDRMALQNTQIRLLQTQIQPHFLYNTLDMISWRLLLHDDQEGSRLVQALAHFYKIGLSRGQEKITLRDELQHVQLYVEIQNFRLDGRIRLDIHADPTCFDQLVIGNILQPLVENAISHGILESEQSSGRVCITAIQTAVELQIIISDDGVGIDPLKMQELVQAQQTNHFGIWNIQQRIQLVYGASYGLVYTRNHSGGTDVCIHLPWGTSSPVDFFHL